MFSSMKLYATVLAFSAAAKAISSLQVPTSPSSGGSITLTWSSDDSDTVPVTVALFSTNPSYNGPFAIANNVNPKDNKATIPLPDVVPGPGYTVALISMSDTSKVFASSTTFSIAPPAPVVSTKPTASSTGASSVKHTSGSATGSHSASANATHSGSVSATHSGSVSVTHSGSVNATHSGSVSATHSGSVSATHSGSVVASTSAAISSLTAPLPSASSAASSAISSFASAQNSTVSSVASSVRSAAASASASAPTGAALAVRVPTAGLALVLGGLLIGAWAV